MHINVQEIGGNVSLLVNPLKAGNEVILEDNGIEFAKVIPVKQHQRKYGRFGAMKGEIILSNDFDGPLPDDIAEAFGMIEKK